MSNWINRRSVFALTLAAGLAAGTAWAADGKAGTFKYAEQVKLITMDPQQQSGSGVPYLRPVYESLFEKAPDGKTVPLLATGFEIDGLNVTISLRQGVSFSNGEAFNAEVAVANINRGVKLAIIEGLKTVDSAEVVDEYTFSIKLKEPDPAIIDSLCYTGGMMLAPAAMADATIDRNPIGTGPYVHSKDLSREGEVQVYTPNPTYWDKDKIGLERYEVWEIPDDTARVNALKTGQIDAGNWLANPQSAIIDRSPDLKLIRNTGGLNYHVILSDREGTVIPAFTDINVRLAMAHSIDRAAFGKAVLFGLSEDSYQPYAKGNWAYNPALEGVYAYDVEKAKEYMAKSGYPDGFTFDMPSIPIYQSRLEALAGFFREIGITMNIVPVEPGTLARRSRTTDFPATNLVWNTNTDPKFVALRYIFEDAAYNPFKTKPSAELLSLAKAGLESVDTEVRGPIYQKMAAQLAEEAFLIFVANSPILIGVSNKTEANPTVVYRYGEDSINLRGLKAND
jgi:peptide/nickel transport system substrate-binding protein